MKPYTLQKIIFLLVAGLLFTELSVRAQNTSISQKGLIHGSLAVASGTGNFGVPADLP